MRKLSYISILLLMLATIAGAAEYTVTEGSSINDAIGVASSGDTVTVACGIYYENVDFDGKDILLRTNCRAVIDGGDIAPCVSFTNGETSNAVLYGFHLRNGLGAEDPDDPTKTAGGGIFINGASPVIKHLSTSVIGMYTNFTNNADHGRELYARNSSVQLSHYELTGRVVPYDAAVYDDENVIYFKDCTDVSVSNGRHFSAPRCIVSINSTGSIAQVEFDAIWSGTITANGKGLGCIGLDEDSYFTIRNCQFTDSYTGPLINCKNAWIEGNVFENNQRGGGYGSFPKGVALFIAEYGKPTVLHNTFRYNKAFYATKGAAIYMDRYAAPTIRGNLFEDNQDWIEGSYYYLRGSTIVFGNKIGTVTDTVIIEGNRFNRNESRAGAFSSIVYVIMEEEAYLKFNNNIFHKNELWSIFNPLPDMIRINTGHVEFIGNQIYHDVDTEPCPKGVHFFGPQDRDNNTLKVEDNVFWGVGWNNMLAFHRTYAVMVRGQWTVESFKNNIFYQCRVSDERSQSYPSQPTSSLSGTVSIATYGTGSYPTPSNLIVNMENCSFIECDSIAVHVRGNTHIDSTAVSLKNCLFINSESKPHGLVVIDTLAQLIDVEAVDVWNNDYNWVGDLAGYDTEDDNVSVDPQLCPEEETPVWIYPEEDFYGDDWFYLMSTSPVAATNNPYGTYGARDVGADCYRFTICSDVESSVYPNPANPRVTIEFTLTAPSYTKVQIYNIRGQLIDTLMNEYVTAGNHSLTWDADDSPSGLYFARITNSTNVTVEKIMVVN